MGRTGSRKRKRDESIEAAPRHSPSVGKWAVFLLIAIGVLAYVKVFFYPSNSRLNSSPDAKSSLSDAFEIANPRIDSRREQLIQQPRKVDASFSDKHRVTLWWDAVPDQVKQTSFATGTNSNIHPVDYVGPESCQKCHRGNYDTWREHPHRRMNALADEANVVGDFSGNTSISYLGGQATFNQEDGKYKMRLVRDDIEKEFEIHQTIGSRFFQYYVGKQVKGPEPETSTVYTDDHVLHFGYWLDAKEWVPIVNVYDEVTESLRVDPFRPVNDGDLVPIYARMCNSCHTTFPMGDMLVRDVKLMARATPTPLHVSMHGYLADAHPELMKSIEHPTDVSNRDLAALHQSTLEFDAREHAVTLGISCEACHLGAKEHAENPKTMPRFFPASPHLLAADSPEFGRTHDNVNYACGRCHSGDRPQYAGGMSTWNSTECSDALRGSCYSELRCVDCHNPHKGIGKKWTATPEKDDARCIKCHTQFQPPDALQQHTHHPLGSEGSRCMNCHMPRINEGMQDVVRTHTIFSPTNRQMIESNDLNACNLCHTDQPIGWTLKHLKDWYDAEYSDGRIGASYRNRKQPVAVGWLKSKSEAIRLVAADSLTRTKAEWALDELIESLDDPFLKNRQFSQIGLERMLGVDLRDFGYRFYMTPEERLAVIEELPQKLNSTPAKSNESNP